MRHPDYKGPWSLLSANKFGRLANGVGGHIKGTNTIKFIRLADIYRRTAAKMSATANLFAQFDPRKPDKTERASPLVGTASTILVKLPHQQSSCL